MQNVNENQDFKDLSQQDIEEALAELSNLKNISEDQTRQQVELQKRHKECLDQANATKARLEKEDKERQREKQELENQKKLNEIAQEKLRQDNQDLADKIKKAQEALNNQVGKTAEAIKAEKDILANLQKEIEDLKSGQETEEEKARRIEKQLREKQLLDDQAEQIRQQEIKNKELLDHLVRFGLGQQNQQPIQKKQLIQEEQPKQVLNVLKLVVDTYNNSLTKTDKDTSATTFKSEMRKLGIKDDKKINAGFKAMYSQYDGKKIDDNCGKLKGDITWGEFFKAFFYAIVTLGMGTSTRYNKNTFGDFIKSQPGEIQLRV